MLFCHLLASGSGTITVSLWYGIAGTKAHMGTKGLNLLYVCTCSYFNLHLLTDSNLNAYMQIQLYSGAKTTL